ncbi:dioxygenase, partial [Vibrio xuii]
TEWEGELRPRAFNFNLVEKASQISPWSVPHLLHNSDCKIRIWKMDEKMDFLVRNADGDELLFIHQGKADLYCDYGHLEVSEGDYVVIPRSTNWRL